MIPFEKLTLQSFVGALFLCFLSATASFFFEPYRTVLAGFALGTAFSLVNGLITARKTLQISRIALGEKKRVYGTGQLQRLIIAGFAGYVSVVYPQYFHYSGVLLGLLTVTLLSFIFSALYHFVEKDQMKTERGEK